MKRHLVALLLAVAFFVGFSGNIAYADSDLGEYKLTGGEHWGSAPCATSYPVLEFTVYQYAGRAYHYVQKYENGSWRFITSPRDTGTYTYTYRISNPGSASYRMLIDANLSASGKVYCKGTY